jgi:two-component sensor histidine kinase
MPADSPQRSGFGKTLIDSLIQQLGASIAWRPACPGTLVTITLPLS